MIGNYIFGLQVDNKFCEKVIKENDSLDIENATVESKNDKRRSSKISWVPLENNPKALQQLIGEANKLYKFSLQEFEQLQYTRYEKDDHYDWHVDTHSKPYSNGMIRKLSFTILLNDEFEGGNFDIWNGHPISEKSAVVNVKYREIIQSYEYENHPFDLVGWDGYFYPWKLNIKDFMPITGKIHQPPPVHQTFQSKGFVVCSFVPRIFDYHEESIPAPYAHSNLDSEEIIYYVEGDFMSRKDIEPESITYHPMGLTHGPQPGKIEQSIGAKSTEEFAVMIDTFKPLNLTEDTQSIEDKEYVFSWRNKNDL